MHPRERYIWAQISILYETDKALLVDNGMKICIPKSWIYAIRLRSNTFEVHRKEIIELRPRIDLNKFNFQPFTQYMRNLIQCF